MPKKPKVVLKGSLGWRIDNVFSEFDINIDILAKKLNYSRSTISKVRLGLKKMSPRLLRLISLKYGINERWMLTGHGEMFDSKIDAVAEESPLYGLPQDIQLLIPKIKVIYYEGTLDEKIKALGAVDIVYNEIKRRKDEEMIKRNNIHPVEKEDGS